jgi:GntR family transcriptional regulator, arabinose operon transcriptional repressor
MYDADELAEIGNSAAGQNMRIVKTKTNGNGGDSALRGPHLKYQQVKNHLLRQIAEGHLKPGDALPPERILAKRLGRGVHTVRHALSELSREKIVHRVQGKGTFVNGEEHSERRQKLDVFAVVLPELSQSLYPSLVKGFIEAAAESHHQVLVCNGCMDTHFQGDMILQLVDKNVTGVAIVPTIEPMPAYQLNVLTSHGIPVVFCHRRSPGLTAPLITWPWEEVGRRVGEAMVTRGHRRLAFVAGGFGGGRYVVTSAYVKGFRAVLSQNGLELPEHRMLFYTSQDHFRQALAKMLGPKAVDRPTAIFCNDAIESERVFLEAMRLGLRVPEDLSIVGFGCMFRDGVLSQRMTAVTMDEVDLGRRAALLIEQMRGGQHPLDSDDCMLVPLGFSEGQSLGPPPDETMPNAAHNGHASSCEEYPKHFGGTMAVDNN